MADCCVYCALDKTGGFSCQHLSRTAHRAWHSSESNYKYSGRRRQREGQLMILWALTLRKTLLLLKGTAWARTTVSSSFTWVLNRREQSDRQTVQPKQKKINPAPHLANQLELNETHLVIHMVAQADVAATQRAISQLPGLLPGLIASCCKCALDWRGKKLFNCKVKVGEKLQVLHAFIWTVKQ